MPTAVDHYYRVKNGYTFFPEVGAALGGGRVFVAPEATIEGQTWKVDEISRTDYERLSREQLDAVPPGRRRVKATVMKKVPAHTAVASPPERPTGAPTGRAAEPAREPPPAAAEPPGELAGDEEAPAPGRPAGG